MRISFLKDNNQQSNGNNNRGFKSSEPTVGRGKFIFLCLIIDRFFYLNIFSG